MPENMERNHDYLQRIEARTESTCNTHDIYKQFNSFSSYPLSRRRNQSQFAPSLDIRNRVLLDLESDGIPRQPLVRVCM